MLRLGKINEVFAKRYPDRIVTIDSHTQGEPTRLVISGIGELPGGSIKDKKEYFQANHDRLRLLLCKEPRGHRGVLSAVLTEPVSPDGDFGLFYMDARRYPYLCGHATIGAITTLVELGALRAEDGDVVITVDTPSGPLETHTRIKNGSVQSVGLDMVPSFVLDTDCEVEVAGFGKITLDLVCVGGFFAMVSAKSIGIELTQENRDSLTRLGMSLIEAANRSLEVKHPERPEVCTVDVAEFYEDDLAAGSGKGVVIYGESNLDRSPCGTGTAAKMTLLRYHNQLEPGQVFTNAGPLGTTFEGRIIKDTIIGGLKGIVARVRGKANITGMHNFVLDAHDPFPKGFLL
jgi:proline racemase